MNILDPLTGKTNVIDITQRLLNRKATIKSMAAPVGYSAEVADLGPILKREMTAAQRHTKLVNTLLENLELSFAQPLVQKPCDSE